MKKNHVHYVFLYINIGATAAYTTHEKKVDDDEREHERRRQQLLKFVHNTHYYV